LAQVRLAQAGASRLAQELVDASQVNGWIVVSRVSPVEQAGESWPIVCDQDMLRHEIAVRGDGGKLPQAVIGQAHAEQIHLWAVQSRFACLVQRDRGSFTMEIRVALICGEPVRQIPRVQGRERGGQFSRNLRYVLLRYGSCSSLRLWYLVGVGVPALVGLAGVVLVAASP
jgi:hypothetical protein